MAPAAGHPEAGPAPDPVGATRPGRLTRRPEYQRVSGAGRRFNTERMTVQGLARADGAGLRVGLTVTKREGRATERNRMKRRLRAAVRELGPEAVALPADLVVVARRALLSAPFSVLVDDLRRAAPIASRPRAPGDAPPRPRAKRR